MEKEYYSIKDLQDIFGCCRSKAYALIKDGLPHIRIGKKIYIPIKEFNEWRERLIKSNESIKH